MNGFRARSFTCAQEALNAARLQAPDLLISDVLMPDISGIDLAILIAAQCPLCKILLFSGQASITRLTSVARDKGYNFRLVSKPIHPADLLSEIGTLAQQPERGPRQPPLRWRVEAVAGDSTQEATAGPQTTSTKDGFHRCSSSSRAVIADLAESRRG
jgi:DNA-binding NtrC family response regulator